MKIFISIYICLTLVLAYPVMAAQYLMLSELGTSARMIGIGNIEGMDYSANAVFENPAVLQKNKKLSLAGFSTNIFDELEVHSVALSGIAPFGRVGVGFISGQVDDIYTTDITNENILYSTGDLEYKDSTIKVSWQRDLFAGLSFGATLSHYSKTIHTVTGTGLGVDLGLFKHFDYTENSVSLLFRNVTGASVKYEDAESEDVFPDETLPFQMILSGQVYVDPIQLYGQMKSIEDRDLLLSAGLSFKLPFINMFEMFAGYKEYYVLDKKKSGASVGLGLDLDAIRINYTFENGNFVEELHKHYFSISVNLEFRERMKLRVRR